MNLEDRSVHRSGLLKAIGPGILYAGAAVGVSHLVQSTRAGATYGFALIWAVLAANLFKYPFFEFGHRYAAATGESLLHGYRRTSRGVLLLYLVLSFCLSVPATAVVTVVTGGLAIRLFQLSWSMTACAAVLLGSCAAMLVFGRYPWLDKCMKVMMLLLTLATVMALVAAVHHGSMAQEGFVPPEVYSMQGLAFLIALMGWMPTPIDAAAWPSLWVIARSAQTGHRPTLGQALFDFNLGYLGATVLALCFLSLGGLVMYGTGMQFEDRPAGFAAQFVNLYSSTLGRWSSPVILVAAFATMLGTVLTVMDGYPRVLQVSCELLWPGPRRHSARLYWVFMGIIGVTTMLVLRSTRSLLRLVDIVTIVAFLSAPVLALLNYRVIAANIIPRQAAPPLWLRLLAWLGILFLTGFSVLFLVVRWGAVP